MSFFQVICGVILFSITKDPIPLFVYITGTICLNMQEEDKKLGPIIIKE